MPWNFDEIPKYVINLDRRRDRWASFQSASGIESLNNIHRWSGTDGKIINLDTDNRVSLFTKYNIIREKRRSHMELNTKGGVGCYISHIEVWKDFLEKSKSEVGIIFEDDAVVDISALNRIKDFIEKSDAIKEPELWDFCILAPHKGSKKHGSMYAGDTTCMRMMEFTGLTAYMITKKGIRKIMPHVYPIQGHVDWFISICGQLQLIDIATPPAPLLRIRFSPTDIQKYQSCEICDIDTDFQKSSTFLPLWRMRMFQFEEAVIAIGFLYAGALYLKRL